MLRLAVLVALVAASSTAAADSRLRVGEGLELAIDGSSIVVVKGKQRAPLIRGREMHIRQLGSRRLELTIDAAECSDPGVSTWSFDELNARIENAAALVLHQHKNYKAAALGFARAVALAPSWNLPAYNLASADQLAGDADGAIHALAPWLATAPIATYVQISSDPELAPLLARPEVIAIRPPTPGTVTVTEQGIGGAIAYAPQRRLLAVLHAFGSGGPCGYSDLEIRDVATNAVVATLPLVTYLDGNCDRPDARTIKARAARVHADQIVLDDLGFVKASLEGADGIVQPDHTDSGYRRLSFSRLRLGLVVKDGMARVFRKDTELVNRSVLRVLDDAVYVDDAHAFVVDSSAGGCEDTEVTAVDVIPVPVTP